MRAARDHLRPCPRCGEARATVRCAEGCGCRLVVCGCDARAGSLYLRRDGACAACSVQWVALPSPASLA